MTKSPKTILKRLLADVDDGVELAGTMWKSKDQASQQVTNALDEAAEAIKAGLLAEMPKYMAEERYDEARAACIQAIERYFGGKDD